MKKSKVLFERIKSSFVTIKFEAHSFLCIFIGFLKAKLCFKKDNINKLEIGIGNSPKKPGFITSDLNLKVDFPYDLRIGVPFESQSIDFIYAEHVLEHFAYNDLILLLKDCYRVLKVNGVFSAVIPDASIWLNAYFSSDKLDLKKYCPYDFGLTFKYKIDYVNYVFYMGGYHRYMFDIENALGILNGIGFKDVHIREFNPNLDQYTRKHESIYIEAIKR